ncbi:MAG: TIGR04255 family protein [Rectinemataceae bacterium]
MDHHLTNAPITEAVIDFQVKAKPGMALTDVEKAFGNPDFGYYVKGPISESTFSFGMIADGQPIPPTTSSSVVGLRLHSRDEKYVLQVRGDRFTLSRLPPYENWESLVEETKRLWALYVARLAPETVIRIATRYINNLRLPLRPGDSFQLYINKLVDVPAGVPQSVDAFMQQFQLSDPSTGARIVLTLALNGLEADGRAPVILDIDAFVLTAISPVDAVIWEALNSLRKLKNDCFFGTLTEKATGLYR